MLCWIYFLFVKPIIYSNAVCLSLGFLYELDHITYIIAIYLNLLPISSS